MAFNEGVQRGNDLVFQYRCACVDCDAEGEIKLLANESGTFQCPEGCGTVYAPWKAPNGKWRLMAVVVPVYGDPESDAVAFDDDEDAL